ncbi:hypothetical protein [Saccharopolyspora tripterygii]
MAGWAEEGAEAILVPSGFTSASFCSGHFLRVNQCGLRTALTPNRLQGRMNALIRMVVMGVAPAGAFAGGALGGWLGTLPVLALGAVGVLLTGGSLLLSHIRTIVALPDLESNTS